MTKNVLHSILYWLQQIFGPDLAMASWKILCTIIVFALFSFVPSFMEGTWFCGDYGYPFAYAEGYGPCQYDNICQDFYPAKLVYVIIISYIVSCIILTMLPHIMRLFKTRKKRIENRIKNK